MQTTRVEELPCKLDAQEKLLKSEQLAQKLGEIKQLEDDKKASAKRFGSEIEEKRGDASKLAQEIRTGSELRPIECTERARYADLMVDLIRLDTGEVVSSRPMHPQERQAALDLGDLAPPKHERPRRAKARKAGDGEESDSAH